MLLSFAKIAGRAAFIRNKCGLLDAKPPYSTRHIMETAFPSVHVTGATLPDGIVEMVERRGKRRTIFYNKKYAHPLQRAGIAHACHHLISDLRSGVGLSECNLPLRQLERDGAVTTDPIEVACDLFAGELLAPFDVLDEYAPQSLFPRDPDGKRVFDDEVDSLASRFNLPAGFMRWRLYDLLHLRKTHFAIR